MRAVFGVRWDRLLMVLACFSVSPADRAAAFGDATSVEIVSLDVSKGVDGARNVAERLSWEVRKRSSVEPILEPGRARLDKSSLFRSPFVYWRGSDEFPPLSEASIEGLRKYIHRGGFILIDDATAGREGFDRAVRRELLRAFPALPLKPISAEHTIYRSFYLLRRPVGRVRGPAFLEGITYGDRIAIVYSRHDLGGALQRDKLGAWSQAVVPGGEGQREQAIRLGVNLVLYALCTDYKDDQVHAPFIMRRRGLGP
ncbi:MAG: DUF4159 domain-containing protein [Deltaproteobacteria bacterium]|nr:MAG: DUF4159 domain-containing protein [Deltaproteobacteria bacterium]UCF47796.1 MAG: DUF4159 domain-containing protein [Myxococcales bacterium]